MHLTINNIHLLVKILPDHENYILKRYNYQYKEKVSFVIYANIGCYLDVAYNALCSFDNSLSKIKLYPAKDCIKWFIYGSYSRKGR